jgi:hypothetical protein
MNAPRDRSGNRRGAGTGRRPCHDPELAILSELEADFARELRELASGSTRARQAERLRQPARITRRALVLVALLSLVGASALAARSVFEGAPRAPAAAGPVLLSAGGSGSDRWQLETYPHDRSTCYALFVAGTVASACGAPGSREVRVTSAIDPTTRFVAGLAGDGVAEVSMRVGHQALVVPTRPPPATATGASSGASSRSVTPFVPPRWFLVMLPAVAAAREAPASLIPRGARGEQLGPFVLDCSLGGASAACRRAAARIAGTG